MLVTSSHEAIAEFLAQHAETIRIRKLLFCVSERRWENDAGILRNLSLGHLVETLHHKYASLDQLTDALFSVVQQLNRQNQYARLAQVILNQMGTLYDAPSDPEQTQFRLAPETTEFFTKPEKDTGLRFSYNRLAQDLDNESEILRIRKMLWCACRQEWVSNSQTLLSFDLPELLQEIQFSFPTHNDLKQALTEVVQNLNRKAEYRAIAETVLMHLNPLYHATTTVELTPDPQESTVEPDSPSQVDVDTLISATQTAASQADTLIASNQTAAQMDTAVSINPIGTPPPPESTEYNPAVTETDFNPSPEADVISTAVAEPVQESYDPFAVRLEVMKYANPLRAKILVFSTLHHTFETRGQDWPHLRTQPFDELLQALYENYGNLDSLSQQLYTTAEQLESPDDSLQAAEAIAKAMKPYFAPSA